MAPWTPLFWTSFLRNCGRIRLCGLKTPVGDSLHSCPSKWVLWGPLVALMSPSLALLSSPPVPWARGASQLTTYLQGCGGGVLPTFSTSPQLGSIMGWVIKSLNMFAVVSQEKIQAPGRNDIIRRRRSFRYRVLKSPWGEQVLRPGGG